MAATATKTRRQSRRSAAVAAATAATSVSWAALVAATTFGLGPVARVRAEVRAELKATAPSAHYRLVVQCYAPGSVSAQGHVDEWARPLGSAQRAVTSEELQRGIAVDVLQVGDGAASDDAPVVVAWVEPGEPVLEFDALRARPSADAAVGFGQVSATNVRVLLS
jgi:hypothetical protein